MSQSVFGAAAVVTMLNRAFNNSSPANAIFNNQVQTAGATQDAQFAFARQFGAAFDSLSNADLASRVMGNMGMLPNDALLTAFTAYLDANNKADRGVIVLQLGQILATMETASGDLAIYAPQALAWNLEVERGFVYSSDTDNTIPQTGDFDTSAVTLSRETDVATSSVFNGYLDYNKYTGLDEQTLTTADRLTGTAGDSDILFAQLTTATQRPTLSGIEIISIDAKAAAVGLDLSDTTGAKTLVNKGSVETAGLTFNNVKNLVDVQVENTAADTTVNFIATAVAGTADNVNLMLNGVGVPTDRPNVTLGGGNIETLTISATGAASQLTNITSTGTKTVTVTGDQALRATLTSAAIETLDASAATGKLNLNVSFAGAKDQTITLGSADDNVTVSALTAKDTITGGDGTDRVTLADAGTNEATKMVGVEQIGVTFTNTNINLVNAADVNLIAVAEATAGGLTVSNVTAAKSGLTFAFEGEGTVAVPVNGDNAVFGDVKFNLASATGKSDVINFTFGNKGVTMAKDATVTIGTLNNSGNNVETLNFTFSDLIASNTVSINDINAGAATALNTLNFTSDSKVIVGNVTDLKALTKVDATGVKAGFTSGFGTGVAGELGANADTSILLGGSGKNNVTVQGSESTAATAATTHKTLTLDGSAGTGVQTLSLVNNDADSNMAAAFAYSAVVRGGSGGDTINVTAAANAGVLVAGGAGIDTINLAGAGMKMLQLSLGDTGATVASADTVNGFNATGDMIDLRNFGFDVGLQTVAPTGLLNGNANEFGGSAVAVANSAGNAVVYVDTNGDDRLTDGDLVIVLNGVAAAGITTADVIWF